MCVCNYSFISSDKCGCTFLPAWCTHIQSDSVSNTTWILDNRLLVTEPEWLPVYCFSRIKINIHTVYLMNHTWPHVSQASLPSTPLSEKVFAWLHTQTLSLVLSVCHSAGCWVQITHKEKWNGLLGEVVHTAHVWTPPYTNMNTMVTELHVQQMIQHNPEQKPTAWPYRRRMKHHTNAALSTQVHSDATNTLAPLPRNASCLADSASPARPNHKQQVKPSPAPKHHSCQQEALRERTRPPRELQTTVFK